MPERHWQALDPTQIRRIHLTLKGEVEITYQDGDGQTVHKSGAVQTVPADGDRIPVLIRGLISKLKDGCHKEVTETLDPDGSRAWEVE